MVGHLNPACGCDILPLMIAVKQALIDQVILRFGKKSDRAMGLPALVVPPAPGVIDYYKVYIQTE